MNVALRQDEALSRAYLQPTLTAAVRIARANVFDNLKDAESAWRRLESGSALMTPYQRFEWAELWHNHVTGPQGIKPFIIVASDEAGNPLFLLPLSLRPQRPMCPTTRRKLTCCESRDFSPLS